MKCLVFVSLIAYVSGHLCLISPVQRGGLQKDTLTTRGASQCIQLESPCGSYKYPEQPRAIFTKGEKATIVFEKNLDHYNGMSGDGAGYFEASILVAQDDMIPIGKVWDSSSIATLTDVALNVTMPSFTSHESNVLQVVYVTKNENAPSVFYQCADIIIQ